jgi:chromosome segregation protein
VIFNGSGTRKAVARASVELIFDNSLGRIAGQWSQYAELAVKRVLIRNGQSEYFINNLQVRRKDITDLFLGTGLGPRAYAIIGQGTISRIIEARPDELRVFLEEAAGVTKYKERRKETEGRLSDTRENLARVEDIRGELGVQMEHLESQAAVARQYRDYQEQLTAKQHLLWLYRRNEAQTERERLARELEAASGALEGEIATLRETEARLEEARECHFTRSDALQGAQRVQYEANAEVARLEAEIRHRRESAQEYESRLKQLDEDLRYWQAQAEKLDAEQERWRELSTLADERAEQEEMRLEARREGLPLAEERHAAARDEADRRRDDLVQADKRQQVEIAHWGHAQRSLQILAHRRERLRQEHEALLAPDETEYESKQEALAELRERIDEAQEDLARQQRELPLFDQQRREALTRVQQVQKERAEAQARRNALERFQRQTQDDGKRGDWLRRHHIDEHSPLWKSLHVEAGWEDAVEAVLRERLSALRSEAGAAEAATWSHDRPGAKLTVLWPRETAAQPGGDSLRARIRCDDAGLSAVLDDWLDSVLAAPDLAAALARCENLTSGECCVTPDGDLVTRQGVTLFAPDAAEHGLLERQREIEELGGIIAAFDERIGQEQARLAEIEARLVDAQNALEDTRGGIDDLQEQAHAIQVETLKLSQMLERFRERQAQIDAGLEDMAAEEETENERLFAAEQAIEAQGEEIERLRQTRDEALARLEQADRALSDERGRVNATERDLQDAQFRQRECQSKIEEIDDNRKLARQQITRIAEELARCEENAAAQQAGDLEPLLQEALDRRVACEHALAKARDALEMATGSLRALEEQRMKIEQGLEPRREAITELKLKERAAESSVEQFVVQLLEAKADEAGLVPELAGARPGALQSAISGLQRSIEALGAVNLAALDELESARERKGFLDAQSEDLTQAMETLENAIRRIDRETRELLQSTYDAVNKSFGELFPILFGGGEARLIMTGEEILDAGLQVMAQPPGKKNSTIHLLSGGEKALTAIALVFSMFQLNPAPFCLLDEVDAPLDDTNTERFCVMVQRMSANTQFLFISHNKIAMEMAQQLVGVTMQESGVSRIVEVDMAEALRMREQIV